MYLVTCRSIIIAITPIITSNSNITAPKTPPIVTTTSSENVPLNEQNKIVQLKYLYEPNCAH